MADYRNLKRAFCFGKALTKYNKKSDAQLAASEVFILMTMAHLSKHVGCTVKETRELLRRNKHHYSNSVVGKAIKVFIAQGWAEQTCPFPGRYVITLDGKCTIMEIEKKVRKERMDR